jgi:mRNA interferase RelE/StbE
VEPHSLRFKPSAEKDLRRLPAKARKRCLGRIAELRLAPRPAGVRQIVGAARTYRLRAGVYRVIYHVDDAARLVTVLHVRHRKDAYR